MCVRTDGFIGLGEMDLSAKKQKRKRQNRRIWVSTIEKESRLPDDKTRFLPAGKSAKVVVHLSPRDPALTANGPVPSSQAQFIKISFRDGGATEFHRHLAEARRGRKWEQVRIAPKAPAQAKAKSSHAGIVGEE